MSSGSSNSCECYQQHGYMAEAWQQLRVARVGDARKPSTGRWLLAIGILAQFQLIYMRHIQLVNSMCNTHTLFACDFVWQVLKFLIALIVSCNLLMLLPQAALMQSLYNLRHGFRIFKMQKL